MGQTVSFITEDTAKNPLTSFYINAAKPMGSMRFEQPKIYISKAAKDAGADPIRIKLLLGLSIEIDKSNYQTGTIPALAYAQTRLQLKALLGINDAAIVDDI